MNPIEKVMVKRNTLFKLAVAVVALVLVLWATGSSLPSLWITPVIIFVLWIAIKLSAWGTAIGTRAYEATGRRLAEHPAAVTAVLSDMP